jgi:hypothetical protein
MLSTQKPARISPTPVITPPASKTLFAPNRRIRPEFGIAKIDSAAEDREPTKARVDGEPTPSATSFACMTPKEYEVPEKKNLTLGQSQR